MQVFKEIRQFDYGKSKNLEKYGTEEPPLIPLKDIDIPIGMWQGELDEIGCQKDNEHVKNNILKTDIVKDLILVKGCTHIDFMTYEKDCKYMKTVIPFLTEHADK